MATQREIDFIKRAARFSDEIHKLKDEANLLYELWFDVGYNTSLVDQDIIDAGLDFDVEDLTATIGNVAHLDAFLTNQSVATADRGAVFNKTRNFGG